MKARCVLTEEVFLRWLSIANAWVKSLNGYGIELRGGRALLTPPFGTGVITFNPLTAVAIYRTQRPMGNREAAKALELDPAFVTRLEGAMYGSPSCDMALRRRLLDACGIRRSSEPTTT
jgi:hypothetical protein